MTRYSTSFKQISAYDLILKAPYQNSFQLPNLDSIHLNLSSTKLAINKKQIIAFLLVLELISNQKSCLTFSKKNKLQLKIKKGMVIGCKVKLNKVISLEFLETLNTFIFPSIKDFHGYTFNPTLPSTLSFSISNLLNFPELENEFTSFSVLPPLHLTIHLKSQNQRDSHLFLSSLNFPIKI